MLRLEGDNNMAVQTVKGNYPHIEWVDLNNDGVLVEVAIVKKDAMGNIYYIRTDQLDNIDKSRLVKILQNRNAEMYELWDLMSNIMLGNGINALDYFHQVVTVLTPQGVKMKPKLGSIGTGGRAEIVLESLDTPAPTPGVKRGGKKAKAAAETDNTDEAE